MNTLNTQIEQPRSTAGFIILLWIVGISLFICGYKIGYYLDTDWDKDGLPNDVEIKYRLDPQDSDFDNDGVKDGKDPYPRRSDISSRGSDTVLIWLTTPDGKDSFHPSDILLFKKWRTGGYVFYDWKEKEHHIQENLTEIEDILLHIGYIHFYRVNLQDLANMLLVECLDKTNEDLCLSSFRCHVPREKMPVVEAWVDRLCPEEP